MHNLILNMWWQPTLWITFKGSFDKWCSHLRFNTDANDFWLKPEISQQALGLTRLLIRWWWWCFNFISGYVC